MKYILWAVQAALIVGKLFAIEPVASWSWFLVLAPMGIIAILIAVLLMGTGAAAIYIEMEKK